MFILSTHGDLLIILQHKYTSQQSINANVVIPFSIVDAIVRLLTDGKGSTQLTDLLHKLSSSANSVLYTTSHVIKQNFSSSKAIFLSDNISKVII
jgi:hypothetical protein